MSSKRVWSGDYSQQARQKKRRMLLPPSTTPPASPSRPVAHRPKVPLAVAVTPTNLVRSFPLQPIVSVEVEELATPQPSPIELSPASTGRADAAHAPATPSAAGLEYAAPGAAQPPSQPPFYHFPHIKREFKSDQASVISSIGSDITNSNPKLADDNDSEADFYPGKISSSLNYRVLSRLRKSNSTLQVSIPDSQNSGRHRMMAKLREFLVSLCLRGLKKIASHYTFFLVMTFESKMARNTAKQRLEQDHRCFTCGDASIPLRVVSLNSMAKKGPIMWLVYSTLNDTPNDIRYAIAEKNGTSNDLSFKIRTVKSDDDADQEKIFIVRFEAGSPNYPPKHGYRCRAGRLIIRRIQVVAASTNFCSLCKGGHYTWQCTLLQTSERAQVTVWPLKVSDSEPSIRPEFKGRKNH